MFHDPVPGEPEQSEPKSREGVTCEPVIREPIPILEVHVDSVPEPNYPNTYGPVKPETYDPVL